jgi:hypothetical protein
MIRSVKPVLTDDLCVVQKEEFSRCVKCTLQEKPGIFIRHVIKEDLIYKDYYLKSSVEQKSLVVALKGLDAKMK